MEIDYCIIPECFVDTKLIKAILPPIGEGGYNHQYGCNEVAKLMQNELKDTFSVGIVDKDKKELSYLNEFEVIVDIESLRLHKHKTRPHYLIFICPAVEKWIMTSAKEVGIYLTDFSLPDDLKKFSKITKTSKSEENDPYSKNLNDLFRTLQQKGAKSVLVLAYWVDYLKNNPYTANLDYLKQQTHQYI
jgi:hypothetical protein